MHCSSSSASAGNHTSYILLRGNNVKQLYWSQIIQEILFTASWYRRSSRITYFCSSTFGLGNGRTKTLPSTNHVLGFWAKWNRAVILIQQKMKLNCHDSYVKLTPSHHHQSESALHHMLLVRSLWPKPAEHLILPLSLYNVFPGSFHLSRRIF